VKAPLPAREEERLQAMQDSGIPDSVSEHAYDETPIAILSLIDSAWQFASKDSGFSQCCVGRLFALAILRHDLLVAPPPVTVEPVSAEPLATSELPNRFHRGAPLPLISRHPRARFACSTRSRGNSAIRSVPAASVELAGGHPD